MLFRSPRSPLDSPASNGGRGLKLTAATEGSAFRRDSPASNGGRGLKRGVVSVAALPVVDSPASNGGRGLKRDIVGVLTVCDGFARQQWRARIETFADARQTNPKPRFARQQWRARIETCMPTWMTWACRIRPPAMAGAD